MSKAKNKGDQKAAAVATEKKQDEKLILKRDFHLGAIKRAEKRIIEGVLEKWSTNEIDEQLQQLTNAYEKFELKSMHASCYESASEDEIKQISNEVEKTESLYFELKAKLRNAKQALEASEFKAKTEVKETEKGEKLPVKSAKSPPKKPVISCGQFTGVIEHWNAFKLDFNKAISENSWMNEQEKFDLLKRSCAMEAQTIISDLTSDFNQAWKLLEIKYGSVYKQISAAMRKLAGIPAINQASGVAIHNLLKQAKQCEVSFQQSKQFEKFDALLAFTIIDKMDQETKRAWERHRAALAESWASQEDSGEDREANQHVPNWQSVHDFLKGEVLIYAGEEPIQSQRTTLSLADVVKTGASASNAPPCKPFDAIEARFAQAATQKANAKPMQTMSEEKKRSPAFLQCKLCDNIHPIYRCKVFEKMDLPQRQNHVRENVLCERCLRDVHQGSCRDEKSNKNCPSCEPSIVCHNSFLCPKKYMELHPVNMELRTTTGGHHLDDEWDE